MSNVQAEVRDGKLVIIVDVSEKTLGAAELSKSGKSKVVASTNGFTGYGPVRVSLNVITGK